MKMMKKDGIFVKNSKGNWHFPKQFGPISTRPNAKLLQASSSPIHPSTPPRSSVPPNNQQLPFTSAQPNPPASSPQSCATLCNSPLHPATRLPQAQSCPILLSPTLSILFKNTNIFTPLSTHFTPKHYYYTL